MRRVLRDRQFGQAGSASPRLGEGEDLLRARDRIDHAASRADAGGEIHQHQVTAAPADHQAEPEGAVRIERIRHRWLADAAALRLAGKQQSIRLQAIDDDRGGLGRKAGQARDLDLGEAALAADQRQDQALIIKADAALAGAAAPGRQSGHGLAGAQPALLHPSSAPQSGRFSSTATACNDPGSRPGFAAARLGAKRAPRS